MLLCTVLVHKFLPYLRLRCINYTFYPKSFIKLCVLWAPGCQVGHSTTGTSASTYTAKFYRADQLNLSDNFSLICAPLAKTTSALLWGHQTHIVSGNKKHYISVHSTRKQNWFIIIIFFDHVNPIMYHTYEVRRSWYHTNFSLHMYWTPGLDIWIKKKNGQLLLQESKSQHKCIV